MINLRVKREDNNYQNNLNYEDIDSYEDQSFKEVLSLE